MTGQVGPSITTPVIPLVPLVGVGFGVGFGVGIGVGKGTGFGMTVGAVWLYQSTPPALSANTIIRSPTDNFIDM